MTPMARTEHHFWPFSGEGFWGNIRRPLLLPATFALLLTETHKSENSRRLRLSEIPCWKGCLANFDAAGKNSGSMKWEIGFYPVWVLGRVAFSLYGCQPQAQHWIKILHPWVQEFYPVLGLGSGGRLLRHFQAPTLHWIHVSLR